MSAPRAPRPVVRRRPAPPDTRKPAPARDKPRTSAPAVRRIREAEASERDARDRDDKPMRQRRALSTVGGEVFVRGEPGACARLRTAMTVVADEEASRAHVHGFHSYPARMHPVMARRLIELFGEPGGRVLDPFCGSGTVLVEARLSGRPAHGVDLNPLAASLSWCKVRGAGRKELAELLEAAHRVEHHAETRRKQRLGATRRYPDTDTEQFDPHVLLELDGLRDGIERRASGGVSQVLWLVLSSILTKVSRKRGDTAEEADQPRRLASGFTIRLFGRKAEELVRRIEEYSRLLPRTAPEVEVECEDARECRSVHASTVDLVVTSPPYPGTYDYLSHHATRLRWLGMPSEQLDRDEIGSRRKAEDGGLEAARRWFEKDMVRVLEACARALKPGGRVVLVVADGVVQGRALRVDELMASAMRKAGITWVATGSQRRPNRVATAARAFTASSRQEHVLVGVKPVR